MQGHGVAFQITSLGALFLASKPYACERRSSAGAAGDVQASALVADAEALLATKFGLLRNAATGQSVLRAGDYSLPDAVEGAVAAVFGLHGVPLPPRQPLRSADPDEPASVTPAVLASTYSIGGVTVSGSPNNTQAVAEFQGQYVKVSSPPMPPRDPSVSASAGLGPRRVLQALHAQRCTHAHAFEGVLQQTHTHLH